MKTAARRILTFSIWIGMLAGEQLFAEQANPDKQPSSQTQPSDSVPGTIFPGIVPSDQSPEAMAGDMTGVENGLWDGGDAGNCCAVCGGGYTSPPCWYIDQGAKIITRSRPRKSVVTYEFMEVKTIIDGVLQPVQNVYLEAMHTHSFNYNIAPGYFVTFGHYLGRDAMDRDDFLEFTFWGFNSWADSRFFDAGSRDQFSVTSDDGRFTYSGGGRLVTHFLRDNNGLLHQPTNPLFDNQWGVGGFDHVDTHFINVDSDMNNFEINLRLRPRGRPDQLVLQPNGRWRRECQPGTFMSYLVGLRGMRIGDTFRFHSQGTVTVTDNDTGDSFTKPVFGDYNIKTENALLGFQIGADIMFRRCKWAWGVRAKVGPYVNFSRNVKEIVNDPVGTPEQQYFFNNTFSQRRQKASLVGEVGFEATYKFKPNLKGRAAYDFMWITGLALAPEQLTWNLDPAGNNTINTNGTIYAHGITLDLEWCW